MAVQKREVDAAVVIPPFKIHAVGPVVQLAVEDDAPVLLVRHRDVASAALRVEIRPERGIRGVGGVVVVEVGVPLARRPRGDDDDAAGCLRRVQAAGCRPLTRTHTHTHTLFSAHLKAFHRGKIRRAFSLVGERLETGESSRRRDCE